MYMIFFLFRNAFLPHSPYVFWSEEIRACLTCLCVSSSDIRSFAIQRLSSCQSYAFSHPWVIWHTTPLCKLFYVLLLFDFLLVIWGASITLLDISCTLRDSRYEQVELSQYEGRENQCKGQPPRSSILKWFSLFLQSHIQRDLKALEIRMPVWFLCCLSATQITSAQKCRKAFNYCSCNKCTSEEGCKSDFSIVILQNKPQVHKWRRMQVMQSQQMHKWRRIPVLQLQLNAKR